MLSQSLARQHHMRRFCVAPVVNDSDPTMPMLEVCGVGYQNKHRSTFKTCPLCNRHLKSYMMNGKLRCARSLEEVMELLNP